MTTLKKTNERFKQDKNHTEPKREGSPQMKMEKVRALRDSLIEKTGIDFEIYRNQSDGNSVSDTILQNQEIIKEEGGKTEGLEEEEIEEQQIDDLEQQLEGEEIGQYIERFLSDTQNIVTDDNMETNIVATETISQAFEEDLTQDVDATELEEFDQESNIDQKIDEILSEIEEWGKE